MTTSIRRAGHSNLLIGGIAAVGIVALIGTVVLAVYIVSRFAGDEQCIKSVVGANSTRSSVLSRLSKERTDADNLRQAWNTAEQRVFQEALHQKTKADAREVRRDFTRALHGYLRADAKYRRLNTLYNQAAQAHPVPTLNCTAGQLNQPVPTVTKTTSAPPAHPSTVVRTSRVPGPVRTVHVPGPVVVKPGPIHVRTVTVPPGHRKHGGHR